MSGGDIEWRPRRCGGLLTHPIEDDEIVLDQQQKLVHRLNAVAAFILEQCDGRRTPNQIVSDVCAHFDVDAERAATDVEQALQKFRGLGLIV